MTREFLARVPQGLVVLGLLATVLVAQDPTADDPIRVELTKSRAAYRASTGKAADALTDSIDKEIQRLEASTNLKVAEQIKLIEQLQAERKTFQASGVLPQSQRVKDAVAEYRTSTKAAQSRCEKAFETAAEKYRTNKDLAAAKTVVEAKKEFVLEVTHFDFNGVWVVTYTGRGPPVRRVAKGDGVRDWNGDACRWERKGGQITVTFPGDHWDKLDIDFRNPDQLRGRNERGVNCTWVRQK